MKLKLRKLRRLIPGFEEIEGEKPVGELSDKSSWSNLSRSMAVSNTSITVIQKLQLNNSVPRKSQAVIEELLDILSHPFAQLIS